MSGSRCVVIRQVRRGKPRAYHRKQSTGLQSVYQQAFLLPWQQRQSQLPDPPYMLSLLRCGVFFGGCQVQSAAERRARAVRRMSDVWWRTEGAANGELWEVAAVSILRVPRAGCGRGAVVEVEFPAKLRAETQPQLVAALAFNSSITPVALDDDKSLRSC